MHTYIRTDTEQRIYVHKPYTCAHTDVRMYIHTYVHTYIHTYIHTYKHTYIHTCIHTYTQMYIHTHIHTHTYTLNSPKTRESLPLDSEYFNTSFKNMIMYTKQFLCISGISCRTCSRVYTDCTPNTACVCCTTAPHSPAYTRCCYYGPPCT